MARQARTENVSSLR